MKKFVAVFICIVLVFIYVLYEAKTLEGKFSTESTVANSVLVSFPEVPFYHFGGVKFSVNSLGEFDRVIVHFWATWCLPCQKEFPSLISYINSEKVNDSVKFLLITLDTDMSEVKKFLQDMDTPLKSRTIFLQDRDESHKNFGTYQLPETYIFDKSLRLIEKFKGYKDWNSL